MFHSSDLSFTPSVVPVFHSVGFGRVSSLSLSFLSCVLLSLYKKLFFLVSVRQSVSLSVFVHVVVPLAVWPQVKRGGGHPVGCLSWWSAPHIGSPLQVNQTGVVLYWCLFGFFLISLLPFPSVSECLSPPPPRPSVLLMSYSLFTFLQKCNPRGWRSFFCLPAFCV